MKITGILIEDETAGQFTAYIAEMPEVISQGATEKEAINGLYDAFEAIQAVRKGEESDLFKGLNKKSFDLVLA